MSWPGRWSGMNAYDIHKKFINEYLLTRKGTTQLLTRDTSRDKRDFDIIKEHHKFLWEENDNADTWEKKLAKKYYDRLFKEYCIGDLTFYKSNKVGLRWRTENELISGKGQFVCGESHCDVKEDLRSWEVNFAYVEHGEKKNALVKIRLCLKCSRKLNYNFKKKEVKRLRSRKPIAAPSSVPLVTEEQTLAVPSTSSHKDVWQKDDITKETKEKSQDQEMEEFLEDLFY